MKKLVAIILLLTLIVPSTAASAANIDWNSMSDQEITDAINQGRIVLASRIPDGTDHLTIVNQDGIEIYLTGNYKYDTYGDYIDLKLEAVVVNGTNYNINISDNGSCINGWTVETSGIYDTPAGRKQKGNITMSLVDADITTYEEITDIDFVLRAYEPDNYSIDIDLEPFTVAK